MAKIADSKEEKVTRVPTKPSYMRKEYMSTTMLSRAIVSAKDLTERIVVDEKLFRNKETRVLMNLDSDVLNLAELGISNFDMCVMDCIYSMFVDGVREFTIEHLANSLFKREVKFENTTLVFKGAFEYMKLDADFFTPEIPEYDLNIYNFLHLTMHKLSEINAKLDCKEIVDKNGNPLIAAHALYGAFLPVKIYEYESRVKKRQSLKYKMSDISVLYEYAEAIHRIAVIPARLLQVKLPANVENAVLIREIAREIQAMKNQNNNYETRIIAYEWYRGKKRCGLFERIGLYRKESYTDSKWAKIKNQINGYVKEILEAYKQAGEISDYKPITKHRSHVGFEITLYEDKEKDDK